MIYITPTLEFMRANINCNRFKNEVIHISIEKANNFKRNYCGKHIKAINTSRKTFRISLRMAWQIICMNACACTCLKNGLAFNLSRELIT